MDQFGQIFSDSILGHGIHRLVELARQWTPVYYMRTDYIGQRTLSAPTDENNRPIGVAHADDLQYVMPAFGYGTGIEEDPDVFMIERFTSWFVHFAKTG